MGYVPHVHVVIVRFDGGGVSKVKISFWASLCLDPCVNYILLH